MKTTFAGLSVSLIALFVSSPALAQDAQAAAQGEADGQASQDGGLGEIVVTAVNGGVKVVHWAEQNQAT